MWVDGDGIAEAMNLWDSLAGGININYEHVVWLKEGSNLRAIKRCGVEHHSELQLSECPVASRWVVLSLTNSRVSASPNS